MAASFGGSFAAAAAVVAMLLTSAQAVQHIVGDDHGWDVSSDVAAWTIDRVFRVGDNIWFAYSAAEESLMELQSKEEYESCDLSNPIRMYVNGLDKVSLDGEGTRYFSSGKLENCRKGLKLHVDVMPGDVMSDGVAASAPESSASIHLKATYLLWIALAINLARVWP
ncbi:blue copper protein 1a [Musa acuminata AAA Group]|uniref:blue copper protein 1a n=1 Tax=Musa acuminata AAA Group TaxID=214697 RepID=UPI0031DB15CC